MSIRGGYNGGGTGSPSTGGPGAGYFQAGASIINQERTNQANAQQASKNRKFQGKEADENRAFQERMSNSAYQRQTEDMKMAGINPMLAFSAGGASTPNGSGVSGAQAHMENNIDSAISTALGVKRLKKDLKQADAEIEARKSAAGHSRAMIDKTRAETDLIKKDVPMARLKNKATGFFEKLLSPLLNNSAKETQRTMKNVNEKFETFPTHLLKGKLK